MSLISLHSRHQQTNMRLSTVFQYWIIFAVLPLLSLGAPVKEGKGKEPAVPQVHPPPQDASHHTTSQSTPQHQPAHVAPQHPHVDAASGDSNKFHPGQVVMAKAKDYEGASNIGLSKDQVNDAIKL